MSAGPRDTAGSATWTMNRSMLDRRVAGLRVLEMCKDAKILGGVANAWQGGVNWEGCWEWG